MINNNALKAKIKSLVFSLRNPDIAKETTKKSSEQSIPKHHSA
jgi:hypothetical protein